MFGSEKEMLDESKSFWLEKQEEHVFVLKNLENIKNIKFREY